MRLSLSCGSCFSIFPATFFTILHGPLYFFRRLSWPRESCRWYVPSVQSKVPVCLPGLNFSSTYFTVLQSKKATGAVDECRWVQQQGGLPSLMECVVLYLLLPRVWVTDTKQLLRNLAHLGQSKIFLLSVLKLQHSGSEFDWGQTSGYKSLDSIGPGPRVAMTSGDEWKRAAFLPLAMCRIIQSPVK